MTRKCTRFTLFFHKKGHKKIILCTIILLYVCCNNILAQKNNLSDDASAVLIHINYGAQLPKMNLTTRFGANFVAGGGIEFLSQKNWIFGAESLFLFGETVKEDVLVGLKTAKGDIIGNDKSLADVVLRERGNFFGGYFGKRLPFQPKSAHAIRLTVGGGWLQHYIRIQDNSQSVAQLSGEYIKGYDRFSGGATLSQSIGYQYFNRNRRLSFYIGMDAFEGFTRSLRAFDFLEKRLLTEQRTDILLGLRAALMIVLFENTKSDEIIY
jgi:hypothetical protein